ncbi:glycogen branching enzyme [Nitrosococcus oceani ATCC 19707]|uniref:1,4-alpha-glucan branching enzyme GlgB n=2 Tax=Nitrosococcus oceani TaxID=1229 RepID=GLGB_NITOC|nr:1,4-alpha-glucan branching protein GlgB [Nitrosococcus oceani]Q3JCN0.1 RecName: Full=1,4-alpha-glucan branching enzyme GlgB; AltName: Full=1,4-alpha-D-glucan:1,4-alpha-D-glucan 6-glucosyl-transferase; AltName: Full=Alpha-(1->4)-glucan branching enzyme; AltName: Full=Glycogen branching enzyme; Short=BE [Nitrosococcus oceani ATCC 19707]ABA57416.1 glycogen branching enzyme [Nitrosococcus oceani ATCC 19707]KFI20189.1 glycogen branching protein [Nitrosococcus oceani C-27]GEM21568.1 glycogen-branc
MTNSQYSPQPMAAEFSEAMEKLVNACYSDPFRVLGPHPYQKGIVVRAYLPHAIQAWIGTEPPQEMARSSAINLFEWHGKAKALPLPYQVLWEDKMGFTHYEYDPYCFPPQLSDYDLHLFGEGKHWHVYRILGSHPVIVDGTSGVLFATWAPEAERVSIVGDFNRWDGRCHPMQLRGLTGVWELFIPGLKPGTLYKYELRNRNRGSIHLKSDPYGQRFEQRPHTASIVAAKTNYLWQDRKWMEQRKQFDWLHQPISVYEVHLGSWQRGENGAFLNYRQLARQLVDYVLKTGFTHIELLPVTEHPLDASWGYQTTGYFAPTSRFGSPDEFRYFVDHCHLHGIGVLMDWVPGHFPKDAHGLAQFDGSALYEHEDPRLGEHRDWGTLIFNYGRHEVRNFLLSSALYWLEEFHIDGLRVDAVASMLYLDYSRQEGDWIPNKYGGRENLEAIDFLRELNKVLHAQHPGVLVIAEESTSWPMVSHPIYVGGLGFSMKWNMGWMNDTLSYMSKDPIYRHYHHDALTFGLLYAFNENFMLPLSHDEVVHGKQSLLYKMPGDEWQRFANLRLLYTMMFTYPGKKLLFMGCEFGQGEEWNESRSLDWYLLNYPVHQGVQAAIKDLNHLYRSLPALNYYDFAKEGFEWIDCHDSAQSVLSYLRLKDGDFVIVVLNFTPVPRTNYRLGVPKSGVYLECFNSDSTYYGGSNMGNSQTIQTDSITWMGRPYSINITVPPLAGIVLRLKTPASKMPATAPLSPGK